MIRRTENTLELQRKPDLEWECFSTTCLQDSSHLLFASEAPKGAKIVRRATSTMRKLGLNIERLSFARTSDNTTQIRALMSGHPDDISAAQRSCREEFVDLKLRMDVLSNPATIDLVVPDAEGIADLTLECLEAVNIVPVWIDGGTRQVSDSIPVFFQSIVVVRERGQSFSVLSSVVTQLELDLGGHAIIFDGVHLDSI